MLKVLLPVDGTPTALAGVRHLMRLVQHGLRAEAVLAHVEPEASLYEIVTARDPALIEGVVSAAAEDAFAPAESLLKGMHISYQREVARGEPGRALLEMVERLQCDVVVMGAHEQGEARGLLSGSVSHWLSQHASVPVTRAPLPSRDS